MDLTKFKRISINLYFLFLLILGLSASLQAATLVVNTTSDVESASDGKCSLREAVASANDGTATDTSCGTVSASDNVIQLESATYCLVSELFIRNSVTLAGVSGGATTLDGGNGSSTSCTTASQSRIVSVITDGITVNLNDLILQGGINTTGGGGIYLEGLSTLHLSQSQILSNQAINTNTLGANGGGIYAHNCESLTLTNTHVDSNLASATGDRAFGGGVSAVLCHSITVENSTFDQNQSTTAVTDKGAYGGGFFASGNDMVTITSSTFSNNEAIHTGTATSTSSDAYGGGVYIYGKLANILNTTISGNKSQAKDDAYGGGFFTKLDSTINISHSTLADNQATGSNAYGGGISHFPADSTGTISGTINIINTLLVDNTVSGTTTSKGLNCYQTIYTWGTNLFSDTSGCTLDDTKAATTVTDSTSSNAELSSLADNGGAVKTQAISSSSSAKDMGTCLDVLGNSITTDARGVTRDAACDIGSYEYVSSSATSSTGDTGTSVASQSGGCSLMREQSP